jgi:hypothetical protein
MGNRWKFALYPVRRKRNLAVRTNERPTPLGRSRDVTLWLIDIDFAVITVGWPARTALWTKHSTKILFQ